jgi:hypothetical protein
MQLSSANYSAVHSMSRAPLDHKASGLVKMSWSLPSQISRLGVGVYTCSGDTSLRTWSFIAISGAYNDNAFFALAIQVIESCW